MTLKLRITRANPSGNLTLLIEGEVPAESRTQVAAKLLQMPEFAAEQAGFVCEPKQGGVARLEMAGGEFCGNAVRAFAEYLYERQKSVFFPMTVEISGASGLIETSKKRDNDFVSAKMPLPQKEIRLALPEPFGMRSLICFEGIWHLIAVGIEATEANFQIAREFIYREHTPAAFGVMFLSEDKKEMTPMVYVHEIRTLYAENSCGSGTTAAAFFLAQRERIHSLSLRQPGGVLTADVKMEYDRVSEIILSGPVALEATQAMEFEINGLTSIIPKHKI